MAIRDSRVHTEWIERDGPSLAARREAAAFLIALEFETWAWPSMPIPELSEQPVFEVRRAELAVPDESPVVVWYRHRYIDDAIDVISVRNR